MKRRAAGIGSLLFAALVLDLVLIQPNHPAALTPRAFLLFPLELPVIVLALIALPKASRITRVVRTVLVAVLVLLSVLKLADFATFTAFSRPFNLVVDMHLIDAGFRLAAGSIGVVQTALATIAVVAAFAATAWLLWWATGRFAALEPPRAGRALAGVGAVLACGLAVAEAGEASRAWRLPFEPPGAAFTARVGVERALLYRDALADLADFHHAAETDPFAEAPGLFDRLRGRDVAIVFVESYGRTSLDNPLYSETHVPTLLRAGETLAETGLAVRSGWLTSPIAGGQSWLAHGTIAAGLEIGDQTRYAAMLGSPRRTLWHLASDAGYRTAAVMPAIQLPWPEAELIGFDEVLAAKDLGYAGPPFNWVTMPDQYTLSAYASRLSPSVAPLFLQIALVSSHAPWTPVPDLLPWEDIGDGSIFAPYAAAGDPPEVVWRDRDRVRDQYRLSIDYALETIFDFIARRARAGDDTLWVVMGDHPPADFVSQIDGRDVPFHLIGPPDAVALFESFALEPGLVPSADAPVRPMASFRDAFVRASTTGAAEGGS